MLVAACLAVVGGSAWAALSAWRRGLDASLAGTGAELRRLADAVARREGGAQEGRMRLVRQVGEAGANRAGEVARYLDPAVTAPLAVAVVPDAAYALLRRAHAEAYRRGVVVISYSLALPFLLFLYQVVARLGGAVDAQ